MSGLPVVGGVFACRHAVWQHFRSSLSFRAAYRTTIVRKTFRERDFRFDEVNQSAPLTVREADYSGPPWSSSEEGGAWPGKGGTE